MNCQMESFVWVSFDVVGADLGARPVLELEAVRSKDSSASTVSKL